MGGPEVGCACCGKPRVAVLRLTRPGDDSGEYAQVCPHCYDNLLGMERRGFLDLNMRVPLPPPKAERTVDLSAD